MSYARNIIFALYAISLLASCQSIQASQTNNRTESNNSGQSNLIHDGVTERFSLLNPKAVIVVAHRGCWSDQIPENSALAIENCQRLGVDMVEIDTRVTRDGVAVVFHDRSLERTTNGSGGISELTWDDLRSLRLRKGKGGFDQALTNESIPRLADVLSDSKGDILFNIDVKDDEYEVVRDTVKKTGSIHMVLLKNSIKTEDDFLSLKPSIRDMNFMPIFRECTIDNPHPKCVNDLGDSVASFDRFNPVAYEITFENFSYLRGGRTMIENHNRRLWVNTMRPHHSAGLVDTDALNDPEVVWGRLIDAGASIIQTDEPAALIKFLQTRNKPSSNYGDRKG